MAAGKGSAGAPTGAEAPIEIPERWSASRKSELVLRLLRGEALDAVARDAQVPAHELEEWRRVFLATGTHGLKKQGDPDAREVRRLQAKLGEVMMRLELAEDLLEKKGYGPELRKRGR
jgi:transposase